MYLKCHYSEDENKNENSNKELESNFNNLDSQTARNIKVQGHNQIKLMILSFF